MQYKIYDQKQMKRILIIDWSLVFLFVLSAYTGIKLHLAGHVSDSEMLPLLAMLHTAAGFLFLITAAFHCATHGNWYKSIIKNGLRKKSKVSVALSIAFLFMSGTGIALCYVGDSSSHLGLYHYKISLATSALCVGHILNRKAVLRHSIKNRGAKRLGIKKH